VAPGPFETLLSPAVQRLYFQYSLSRLGKELLDLDLSWRVREHQCCSNWIQILIILNISLLPFGLYTQEKFRWTLVTYMPFIERSKQGKSTGPLKTGWNKISSQVCLLLSIYTCFPTWPSCYWWASWRSDQIACRQLFSPKPEEKAHQTIIRLLVLPNSSMQHNSSIHMLSLPPSSHFL
jgi:hypothetical protein